MRRATSPLIRSLKRLRNAFWRRRVAHWLVRTAWLTLLVPTIFMAGYLWLGWQAHWTYWAYPMVLIALVSTVWALRPINLAGMVRRLDGRLDLRARLVTGFEVSSRPQAARGFDNSVVERLLQEAVGITSQLRRHVHSLNQNLWLELQTLIAVAALFSALLMLDALTPHLPNTAAVALPDAWQEPTADQVIPPDPQLQPPPFPPQMQAANQPGDEEQMRAALAALADALRDQAATRAIAEALDQGNLGEAAAGLRRLADQLGDLSEEARQELGRALQEAADNMSGEVPDLTQPLEAGREALNGDELGQASRALEQLADAIESLQEAPQETAQTPPQESGQPGETGEQPQASSPAAEPPPAAEQPANQGEGSGAGEGEGSGDQPPSEEERLALEGQPLELESDPATQGRVLQPAELDAQGSEETTADAPFSHGSASAAAGDLGPDPLAYPWDKREVIRSYFTP